MVENTSLKETDVSNLDWPTALYNTLKAANIRHMAYVPDAGHTALINLLSDDAQVITNVLTTEEEGIAIATGSWLGGLRSVVLMQSSGVGNCMRAETAQDLIEITEQALTMAFEADGQIAVLIAQRLLGKKTW